VFKLYIYNRRTEANAFKLLIDCIVDQWRRNEFERAGTCPALSRRTIFLVVPLHFLAQKVQLVVLVSAFLMVSTVWSVSCLPFYSRCIPRAQPFIKMGGHHWRTHRKVTGVKIPSDSSDFLIVCLLKNTAPTHYILNFLQENVKKLCINFTFCFSFWETPVPRVP